ncbi:MAG: hypothetical protein ABI835_15220 [Chloroflexota bacterium]
MRRFVIFAAFTVLSVLIVSTVSAQETCSSFVTQALGQLSNNCGDLSRNSACYGYNNVVATFFDTLSPASFLQPNDRVELANLQTITTSPLNVETGQWGIAVVKAQADLPDALPGQAVTFLLLGDVQLQTGITRDSDQNPMQAIYFTTGIGDTRCTDAPESSLIIQGPENITVNLRVNGADIQLGSTAIFRSTANNTMECGVIDGAAHVAGGQTIPAGFAARVPLDPNLNANGDWGGNQPIDRADATALQVLREVPEGVLNYTPDVPTADEVELLASLDSRLVAALDADVLRELVRVLIAQGATPEFVAEWDVQTLRDFVASNADEVIEVEATEEPFASDVIQTLLAALDEYLLRP